MTTIRTHHISNFSCTFPRSRVVNTPMKQSNPRRGSFPHMTHCFATTSTLLSWKIVSQFRCMENVLVPWLSSFTKTQNPGLVNVVIPRLPSFCCSVVNSRGRTKGCQSKDSRFHPNNPQRSEHFQGLEGPSFLLLWLWVILVIIVLQTTTCIIVVSSFVSMPESSKIQNELLSDLISYIFGYSKFKDLSKIQERSLSDVISRLHFIGRKLERADDGCPKSVQNETLGFVDHPICHLVGPVLSMYNVSQVMSTVGRRMVPVLLKEAIRISYWLRSGR